MKSWAAVTELHVQECATLFRATLALIETRTLKRDSLRNNCFSFAPTCYISVLWLGVLGNLLLQVHFPTLLYSTVASPTVCGPLHIQRGHKSVPGLGQGRHHLF